MEFPALMYTAYVLVFNWVRHTDNSWMFTLPVQVSSGFEPK